MRTLTEAAGVAPTPAARTCWCVSSNSPPPIDLWSGRASHAAEAAGGPDAPAPSQLRSRAARNLLRPRALGVPFALRRQLEEPLLALVHRHRALAHHLARVEPNDAHGVR